LLNLNIATATFLRLAWAFILALNAFSLTTQVDPTHRKSVNKYHALINSIAEGVSIFMFAANATALLLTVMVGCLEVFKFKIASFTSRVSFEVAWMAAFWILETGQSGGASTCVL
jgi:hypothetical protein